jgi:hypothetical protein
MQERLIWERRFDTFYGPLIGGAVIFGTLIVAAFVAGGG